MDKTTKTIILNIFLILLISLFILNFFILGLPNIRTTGFAYGPPVVPEESPTESPIIEQSEEPEVQKEPEIPEFENCVECHPTGREGEAASLGYGRSGRESSGETGDGQEIGQAQGGELTGDGGSPQGRGQGHGGGQ